MTTHQSDSSVVESSLRNPWIGDSNPGGNYTSFSVSRTMNTFFSSENCSFCTLKAKGEILDKLLNMKERNRDTKYHRQRPRQQLKTEERGEKERPQEKKKSYSPPDGQTVLYKAITLTQTNKRKNKQTENKTVKL